MLIVYVCMCVCVCVSVSLSYALFFKHNSMHVLCWVKNVKITPSLSHLSHVCSLVLSRENHCQISSEIQSWLIGALPAVSVALNCSTYYLYLYRFYRLIVNWISYCHPWLLNVIYLFFRFVFGWPWRVYKVAWIWNSSRPIWRLWRIFSQIAVWRFHGSKWWSV